MVMAEQMFRNSNISDVYSWDASFKPGWYSKSRFYGLPSPSRKIPWQNVKQATTLPPHHLQFSVIHSFKIVGLTCVTDRRLNEQQRVMVRVAAAAAAATVVVAVVLVVKVIVMAVVVAVEVTVVVVVLIVVVVVVMVVLVLMLVVVVNDHNVITLSSTMLQENTSWHPHKAVFNTGTHLRPVLQSRTLDKVYTPQAQILNRTL